MDNFSSSLKKKARLAGIFILINTVIIIYGVIIVSSKIGISGTDGMADNILANEWLFRSGILSRIASSIPTLLLAFTLYSMFEKVDGFQSKLMFVWILIAIPFQFVAEAFNLTSLMVAKGELLKSMDISQRHDFTVFLINVYNNIVSIGQFFWGLWLFPFGLLVFKSKFIPKLFGVILFLGGTGYFIDYLAFLFYPLYRSITVLGMLLGLTSQISIMLWLLIKGTRDSIQVDIALRV